MKNLMKKIKFFFVLSLLFLKFNLAYSMNHPNYPYSIEEIKNDFELFIQERLERLLSEEDNSPITDSTQGIKLPEFKIKIDNIKENMKMPVNKMDNATDEKIYLDITNSISSICQKLKNMNEENNATDLDTFDSIAFICRTLYKENDNADIIDLDILDSISSECQELKKMDKKDNEIYINMINFIFSICQKLEKRKS